MATWPELEELERTSGRGGVNTSPGAKNKNRQVTVRTQMFCGFKLEESDRVFPDKVDRVKNAMKRRINGNAARHIKSCVKCKKHYGRT